MDFSLADYQPWTCMRVLIVPAETEGAFLSVTAFFTWGLFKKKKKKGKKIIYLSAK